MAAVFPRSDYRTFVTALASGSKTTVYTVGDDSEKWADVVGITISDSTGSVNSGATIHCTLRTGVTERVLANPKVDEIDNDYHLECLPVHLEAGGTIAVTGASGHHVWITIHKGTVAAGAATLQR